MYHKHGLKIDIEGIARGFYKLIPEENKACMIYGMLPAQFMEALENQLRDKLTRIQFNDESLTEDDARDYGLKIRQDIIGDIMREISAAILRIASEKGLCIV